MKKILLLSALECPYRGRLVETQFLKPLLVALEDLDDVRATYLSIMPLFTFFSRRSLWGEWKLIGERRRRLRHWLKLKGVAFHSALAPYPLWNRQFNMNAKQAMLYTAFALPSLLLYLSWQRPSLIISRNYPATLLAWCAWRLSGLPYVFDMRGLYPEVSANAGVYDDDSPDYRFWKRRERRLINEARCCVVVSQPFADHVRRLAEEANIALIPCCVDTDEVKYDPGLRREAKERYGLSQRFVLLHLGSFGTLSDRGLAAKYLKRFRRVRPEAVLVAATGTPAFVPQIEAAFLKEGLSPSDFKVIHPQPGQLNEVRALGDAGLILERRAANTHASLPVKLGEYLASGLPVICTPFVEGAAALVRRYDCGLIVDPDDEDWPLDWERKFLARYPILRENGFRLVGEYLSIKQCARRWRRMMEEVLKKE